VWVCLYKCLLKRRLRGKRGNRPESNTEPEVV
jgi:hypothetical protein